MIKQLRKWDTLEQNSIELFKACTFKEVTSAKFTVSYFNKNHFNSLFHSKGENKTGFSIYDGEFADESYNVKHEEQGLLGMCKRSGVPHTNECQFYVTTGAPLTFLDGQTVIFGRVIEGFRVFKLIEKMDCINEKP